MTLSRSRIAGLLYLVPTVLGPFSMMYVPSKLAAMATGARALDAHSALLRLAVASDLVIVLAELALTAVLFASFEPRGRVLSLMAAYARLAMTVLQAGNVLFWLAALRAPDRPGVLFALALHGDGVHLWEVLFSLHVVLTAALIARGVGRARVLAALLGLAGLGYALNGLGSLVVPSSAPLFARIVGVTALVGEVPFVVWLLLGRADAVAGAPEDHARG